MLQQCEAAGSFEAVMQALQGLPRPPGADAEHHASLLHMLGSLRDIRWAGTAIGCWGGAPRPAGCTH